MENITMNNELKNFLEKNQWIDTDCPCAIEVNTLKHDKELINFVLDLVEKEVEKKYESWVHAEELHGFNADCIKKDHRDISTIINNLKV